MTGEPEGAQRRRAHAAMNGLDEAIRRLERAVAVTQEANDGGLLLSDDLARMERDRAELAERLDGATAKAERLDAANRAVAKRLISLMDGLRQGTVLPASSGEPSRDGP